MLNTHTIHLSPNRLLSPFVSTAALSKHTVCFRAALLANTLIYSKLSTHTTDQRKQPKHTHAQTLRHTHSKRVCVGKTHTGASKPHMSVHTLAYTKSSQSSRCVVAPSVQRELRPHGGRGGASPEAWSWPQPPQTGAAPAGPASVPPRQVLQEHGSG